VSTGPPDSETRCGAGDFLRIVVILHEATRGLGSESWELLHLLEIAGSSGHGESAYPLHGGTLTQYF